MKKIAIVPARSGSKGLKDKNIIDLCGKPLLAYSIEAGLKTGLFEKVILSTDSEKYAEIGRNYGAEVIMRDKQLASDSASTFVVIEDVLQKNNGIDYFVLLQPTSPMRDAVHVKEAAELFESNYMLFDFLVSVKEAEHTNALVKPIGKDNSLKFFDADFSNYKRQTYKEYSPNGAIFIGKCEAYQKQKHFFGSRALAYQMNAFDSIDIDTELDYEFACLCMEKKNKQNRDGNRSDI